MRAFVIQIAAVAMGTAFGIGLVLLVAALIDAYWYSIVVWYNCLSIPAGELGC
ncbi:hypothetical protein OAM79_00595 [Litorivicinus sp.]|nr:hypothetical protein [Litorivicinus sp.]